MLDENRDRVKNAVETAYGTIAYYGELARKGELSASEAKELAAKAISQTRYDENEYFWIQDTSPRMIMHPIKPELNGKDVSQEADPTGKKLFVECANVARSNGQGFVEYQWAKPNETKPSPKVSFVKYLPDWNWIIGSGVYVDDVDAATWALFRPILLMTLVIAIVGFLVAHFAATSIARPMNQLAEVANAVALGDTQVAVAYESADEVGIVADAFRKTCDYISQLSDKILQVSRGNTDVEIQPKSEKDVLSKAIAGLIDTLHSLLAEAKRLATAAAEGDLNARADSSKYEGAFKALLDGINETVEFLTKPINDAAVVLERVSARDLTARVVADYKGDNAKIKEALNLATQDLQNGMLQVNTAAEQVASASDQIASSSQAIAQGASEQSSAIQELASSIQEIASTSKQNAGNADEAKKLADVASEMVQSGLKSMERMSETIGRIKESSDQTANIVKTIDEIAFQTNLLALNAAVEAARAGDAGKGFAVVAEEVRNLAMRSAEAAKQTAELIAESTKNSDEGVVVNQEVTNSLQEIYNQITKVNEVAVEIAAASRQQAQGVEEINQAMSQLEQATQESAATSEELASAAQELSSQAAELKRLVASFRLDENGNGNGGHGKFSSDSQPVTAKPDSLQSDKVTPAKPKKEKVSATTGKKPAGKDPSSVIPLDDDAANLAEF